MAELPKRSNLEVMKRFIVCSLGALRTVLKSIERSSIPHGKGKEAAVEDVPEEDLHRPQGSILKEI